jgi:mannosyltransferase
MSRRIWYWLAGLLFFGLVLRFIGLQERSIAYDDAFSIFLASQSLPNIISGTAADTMPPLYYFLLHAWIQIGGLGLVWLRLLSVLLNLGSALFLFGIVSRIAGEKAGLWSAFLWAISPLQIYHAQDLRMYALLAICQLGYLWFFLRITQNETHSVDWFSWAGLVFLGTAAMYSHNLAVFVLVLPDAILLVRRSWHSLKQLLAAQFVIGLLTIPWLLMLPGQIAKIQTAFWTPQPGVVEVIQAMLLFITNLPLPGMLLAVGLTVSLVAVILVVLEGFRLRMQGKGRLPGFLIWLTMLPPTLLFIVSYVMRPVFVTRGFLAAAMGFLGLAGVVIAMNWPRLPAWILLAMFVIGAGIGLPVHYTFNEFPRSPFSTAMNYLESHVHAGDVVIHDNKLSYFPSQYYAPNVNQVFLADQPGSPNDTLAPASQQALGMFPKRDLKSALGGADTVYFIVFETTINDYLQGGMNDHPNLAALNKQYPVAAQTRFNDLIVYRFSR